MTETAISADPRYRSRPTIRVAGREVARVSALVHTFSVTEREGGLSALELRMSNFLDDGGLAFEDERDLKLGSEITIYSGDESRPREIFRGTVSGMEADFTADGASEILVLAEDPLQRARMARRTGVHDNLTISSLADDVARVAGLKAVVTGLTDNVGTWVQLNESDLAFLRRVLSRYDGDLQVVGSELHVTPRRDVSRGTVELAFHGQLYAARFRADLAGQVTETTTSGWDATRGARVAGTSSGANLGPGSGRTGASLLQNTAFKSRSEHIGHPPVTTDAEARALADTAFDRRARRLVVVEGTAEGNPLIRVGTQLKITGTSPRFDNTYYAVSATHRYDGSQYWTDFEAECAFLGNP